MNEMKQTKGNKLPIILGILVLLCIAISIGVGFYFKKTTPDKVYEYFIEEVSEAWISFIDDYMPNEFNLQKQDMSMTGNFQFDTSLDLEEYNFLKDYTFGFQLDGSFAKEIAKLNIFVQDEKNLLDLQMLYQDQKGYMTIPSILSNYLEMDDLETDVDSLLDIPNYSFSKNDYKVLVEELKNIIIETLDKTKFSKNKNVRKTLHGKDVLVTEYHYLLDRDNQLRTQEEIISKILQNEQCLNALHNITHIEMDKLKTSFENAKNSFSYESDIKFVISTEGLKENIVSFELISGEQSVSVVSYNEKNTITINDFVLDFIEEDNQFIYSFDEDGVEGTITLSKDIEKDSKFVLDFDGEFSYMGEKIHLVCSLSFDYDTNVLREDVTSSKKLEDFTNEELLEIYNTFINKYQGTSIETLFKSLFEQYL